jgi:hypothetical protein
MVIWALVACAPEGPSDATGGLVARLFDSGTGNGPVSGATVAYTASDGTTVEATSGEDGRAFVSPIDWDGDPGTLVAVAGDRQVQSFDGVDRDWLSTFAWEDGEVWLGFQLTDPEPGPDADLVRIDSHLHDEAGPDDTVLATWCPEGGWNGGAGWTWFYANVWAGVPFDTWFWDLRYLTQAESGVSDRGYAIEVESGLVVEHDGLYAAASEDVSFLDAWPETTFASSVPVPEARYFDEARPELVVRSADCGWNGIVAIPTRVDVDGAVARFEGAHLDEPDIRDPWTIYEMRIDGANPTDDAVAVSLVWQRGWPEEGAAAFPTPPLLETSGASATAPIAWSTSAADRADPALFVTLSLQSDDQKTWWYHHFAPGTSSGSLPALPGGTPELFGDTANGYLQSCDWDHSQYACMRYAGYTASFPVAP